MSSNSSRLVETWRVAKKFGNLDTSEHGGAIKQLQFDIGGIESYIALVVNQPSY